MTARETPKTLDNEIQSSNLNPRVAAILNLVRTADLLAIEVQRFFRPYGITHQQFNVLRILRGGPEEGLRSLEIGSRMITRVPDVTRLVDRMEKVGLVTRSRSRGDRRIIHVQFTKKGGEISESLLEPLTELHLLQLSALSSTDIAEMNRVLELTRSRQQEAENNS